MLAILLLVPGFQISFMALTTLWALSVQKWSLRKLRIEDKRWNWEDTMVDFCFFGSWCFFF